MSPSPSLEDFEVLRILGVGGWGTVYLVRKKNGVHRGRLFAMKELPRQLDVETWMGDSMFKNYMELCKTERNVCERVRNAPFLVTSYCTFETEDNLYLVMEYMEGGDLYTFLMKRITLTEDEVRFYLAEIILAVEKLHEMGVIHRDLKPDNILMDSSGHIAIADYGLCKEIPHHGKDKRAYTVCGTNLYMAPEVIKGMGYSKAVDWWSTGIIAYEMLFGFTPFEVEGEAIHKFTNFRILKQRIRIPQQYSPEVTDFIRKLLRKDPKRRLGGGRDDAVEIKRHPFFAGINWTDIAQKTVPVPYMPLLVNENTTSISQDLSDTELFHQTEVSQSMSDKSLESGKCQHSPAPTQNSSTLSVMPAARASHGSAVEETSSLACTSNTAPRMESTRLSHKRKRDSESQGSITSSERNCRVKPSSSMTLTQNVDLTKQTPHRKKCPSDEEKSSSTETVQPLMDHMTPIRSAVAEDHSAACTSNTPLNIESTLSFEKHCSVKSSCSMTLTQKVHTSEQRSHKRECPSDEKTSPSTETVQPHTDHMESHGSAVAEDSSAACTSNTPLNIESTLSFEKHCSVKSSCSMTLTQKVHISEQRSHKRECPSDEKTSPSTETVQPHMDHMESHESAVAEDSSAACTSNIPLNIEAVLSFKRHCPVRSSCSMTLTQKVHISKQKPGKRKCPCDEEKSASTETVQPHTDHMDQL
ncbi:probable serine/threonine-protein kinase DDB_G0288795 isoform X4 [Zootermopsis nevadensis]|uniref:non-specific serine/threonine protein kinase n=4 Tax=Zootermopsis nevadensis TaxID=136037 RepID=A0A067R2V3_ZOONE|nr:probable serine/threonine-protein kinase DDB_G0288795 isoform X4 [Zootermopsis nevadensis]KDR13365.1 Ribosomal protein S6 kinase alpha-5 [Zootermopsis nevadensis]